MASVPTISASMSVKGGTTKWRRDMTERMPQSASTQRQRGHGELAGRITPRGKEHHREEADDRREAPKGLHGLTAGSGEGLDQRHGSDRAAEHPEHRGA